VITRNAPPSDDDAKRWTLQAYRLDGARLVRTIDAMPLYQLSSATARWIGAELRDVDLYLELTTRTEGIEVGGLLTTRASSRAPAKIRDVVVISTIPVPHRRGKPSVIEHGDAPVAGTPPGRATQDAGDASPASTGAESETPRQ
jgi:pimeloyl-ACP methyl ester carboxylesterase